MRHWTFGWAMTFGASTIVAAATAVAAPLADTRNRRRSVVIVPSSPRHELMVGAFSHVVPRTDQGLEFRVGSVHLAGHRRLLRFFLDDLGRELLEIAQHRCRKGENLDLVLELPLEALEGDRILRLVVRAAMNAHGCHG